MAGMPDNELQSGGDPNLSVFLALYLILLAFFIMLNSMSTQHQDKVEAAFSSLHTTFQSVAPSGGIGLFSDGRHERGSGKSTSERFLAPLHSLLSGKRLAPGFVAAPGGGTIMIVSVPASMIFKPGTATLAKRRESLFSGLADHLTEAPYGFRPQIEIRVGAMIAGLGGGRDFTTASMRAIAIGKDLQTRGVPASVISSGTDESDVENVTLFVRLRSNSSAAVSFGSLVGE